MKVEAPFYLLKASHPCWKCGVSQKVFALACGSWVDEESDESSADYGDEPAILTYVGYMPPELLACVRQFSGRFEIRESMTAETGYYVNACDCGTFAGDFYMHCPGGAFGPLDEQEARTIQVLQLPMAGLYHVDCKLSIGSAAVLIVQHGERLEEQQFGSE